MCHRGEGERLPRGDTCSEIQMSRLALALIPLQALPFGASGETLKPYASQPNEDAQKTVDAFMRQTPTSTWTGLARAPRNRWRAWRPRSRRVAGQPDMLLIADIVTLEGLAQ
jgi:iron(III) transport system substrate-binding protein